MTEYSVDEPTFTHSYFQKYYAPGTIGLTDSDFQSTSRCGKPELSVDRFARIVERDTDGKFPKSAKKLAAEIRQAQDELKAVPEFTEPDTDDPVAIAEARVKHKEILRELKPVKEQQAKKRFTEQLHKIQHEVGPEITEVIRAEFDSALADGAAAVEPFMGDVPRSHLADSSKDTDEFWRRVVSRHAWADVQEANARAWGALGLYLSLMRDDFIPSPLWRGVNGGTFSTVHYLAPGIFVPSPAGPTGGKPKRTGGLVAYRAMFGDLVRFRSSEEVCQDWITLSSVPDDRRPKFHEDLYRDRLARAERSQEARKEADRKRREARRARW
ncbi:hypothetical protein BJF85_00500 [Saccharomonospora sp. CUA-673]|uniref:hypothetical protein n=1 Tax=Saccharomonospora sp. CUA-673 TaxID=1904969 RepID=UPI0009603FC1|nr:hypothetical protein [Saccharomonospora sp. CUA-673]OLT46975.1 hypothetical protein BJF85_00500 [Saccharomonospora sp. CUA-673]